MKKLLRALLISAGLVIITACSTTNPNGADITDATDATVGAGANGGVIASGAGEADSFAGAADNSNATQVGNQNYYFDFDKYDVHPDDLPSIKVQANYLATQPKGRVLLEGNTDERGSREYNIALGNKRAQSVAEQLKANGVNTNQITTVSYGAEKPVALGHDETAWAKNRRVNLTYQTPITLDQR